MKLVIDTSAGTLTTGDGESQSTVPLYSRQGFEALSRQWVRVGWSLRYYFNFSWFGRPILQLPEDLVRLQEVIYQVQPDVIIETGVFGGGSMLFHASLCQALGKGRVIGVDLLIPPEVRQALEDHPLGERITLVEGNSVAPEVLDRVAGILRAGESVFVILDSAHERAHVRAELDGYSRFVTPGSYIVAADGIMRDLADVPGGDPGWSVDNPLTAAAEFADDHPEFEEGQPPWPARESELTANVTYWPHGWLRRRKPAGG